IANGKLQGQPNRYRGTSILLEIGPRDAMVAPDTAPASFGKRHGCHPISPNGTLRTFHAIWTRPGFGRSGDVAERPKVANLLFAPLLRLSDLSQQRYARKARHLANIQGRD